MTVNDVKNPSRHLFWILPLMLGILTGILGSLVFSIFFEKEPPQTGTHDQVKIWASEGELFTFNRPIQCNGTDDWRFDFFDTEVLQQNAPDLPDGGINCTRLGPIMVHQGTVEIHAANGNVMEYVDTAVRCTYIDSGEELLSEEPSFKGTPYILPESEELILCEPVPHPN